MENNQIHSIGDRVKIRVRGKKKIYVAEFTLFNEHKRKSLKTTNKKVAMERATQIHFHFLFAIP